MPHGSAGRRPDIRDSGPLWRTGQPPAGQVLTVAEEQAAAITHEAWDQAAAIRQAAEQEAAAIRQQATDQAAAIREAAEREAADLKAALLAMSGELGRVAAFVTDNLAAPTLPGIRPVSLPPPRLAPLPEAPPATRPARPTTRPGARPAKPATRPRQFKAIRLASIGAAGLVVFAVTAGSTEVATHGYKFFLFRQGGTGSTAGNETDQQFLNQEASSGHHAAKAHPAPTAHNTPGRKGRHALEPGHTAKGHSKKGQSKKGQSK